MTIPNLTESSIRQRTSDQSWQRGQAYFNDGSVSNVTWRGDQRGSLTAEVDGSDYEPYTVEVEIADGAIISADCSCPYDFGGDCKHIVAVLLYILNSPDEVDERMAIDTLIADLDREQLHWIVQMLAEAQPALSDQIEQLVAQAKRTDSASTESTESKPDQPIMLPFDEKLLRRQIIADVRGAVNSGYDGWGEEAWYESDFSIALEPALSQIQLLLEADQIVQALQILTVATEAWDSGADRLDEYVYEHFEGGDAEFLSELSHAWTETLLRAELTAKKQAEWADRLDGWVETIFCGRGLEMAARAARDGWTYPPLVAAMGGNITEFGAWAEDEETEYWVNELATIRIDILEARGDLDAARNLAEAEGQYERYLQLKIKLGQIDEAIAETKENVTSPTTIHKIAQTLADAGETSTALELGQHCLDLKPPSKKSDPYFSAYEFEDDKATLAAWLRDVAQSANQPDVALSHAQSALRFATNLTNYTRLQEVAGTQWTSLKTEVLESVMRGRPTEYMVEILLHEQMHKEVTQAVDQIDYFYSIDKVLNAVQTEFPEWAFRQCAKRGEDVMTAGKAKYYDAAADWLRKGRDILRSAGHEKLWSSYIEAVMSEHHRKRKLIPMLREIA